MLHPQERADAVWQGDGVLVKQRIKVMCGAAPAGETLDELEDDVRHYLAALRQPVLEDAVFCRPDEAPPE